MTTRLLIKPVQIGATWLLPGSAQQPAPGMVASAGMPWWTFRREKGRSVPKHPFAADDATDK
jgi:hypothetical protein